MWVVILLVSGGLGLWEVTVGLFLCYSGVGAFDVFHQESKWFGRVYVKEA